MSRLDRPVMKSRSYFMLVLLGGCSTAPCYDLMDCLKPGKMYKDQVTPYGGVCIPGQGTLPIGAAPCPVPNLPSTPAVPVPVIPGPAPISGPTPSPAVIPPPPPPPMLR